MRKIINPTCNRYTRTVKERFEEKFTKTESCWIWNASKHPKGYGHFVWKEKNEQRAHRVSYIMYVGEIPKGMIVRHRCDNPSCVNPKHLILGVQNDNVQDMIKRGRAKHTVSKNPGSKNPSAKITEKDVINIRKSKLSLRDLSNVYGLSPSHLGAIRNGKVWSNVHA